MTFQRAGPYGLQASIANEGGPPQVARTRFDVKARSEAPAVGAAAPRSHNLTAADGAPPIELCTASEDICRTTQDLRQITIADAIEQGKPLVVLFATPGFCTSQTCGPQLEVLQAVAERYRGRVNFVHVEIFKDPQARTINSTVQEWNLPSEPWTFVVDSSGRIADRFDGITAGDEIEQALQPSSANHRLRIVDARRQRTVGGLLVSHQDRLRQGHVLPQMPRRHVHGGIDPQRQLPALRGAQRDRLGLDDGARLDVRNEPARLQRPDLRVCLTGGAV